MTGIAKDAASGATKGAEALKERVVGPGEKHREYPPMNSAFVTFEKQIAAHLAVQVLAHHEPYRMGQVISLLFWAMMLILFFCSVGNRYIEVSPDDVIWANLGMNPYEQKVRFF